MKFILVNNTTGPIYVLCYLRSTLRSRLFLALLFSRCVLFEFVVGISLWLSLLIDFQHKKANNPHKPIERYPHDVVVCVHPSPICVVRFRFDCLPH